MNLSTFILLSTVFKVNLGFSPPSSHDSRRSSNCISQSHLLKRQKKVFFDRIKDSNLKNLQAVKVPASNTGSIVSGICSTPGIDIVIDESSMSIDGIDEESSSIKTTSITPYDWSFIDQVYLITCPNADPNSQRLTKTKQTLSEIGFTDDKIQIREFETDDEDRIRGCYTSHISVLKEAQLTLNDSKKINFEGQNDWFQNLIQSFFDSEKKLNNNIINDKNDGNDSLSIPNNNERTPKVLVFEDNLELTGNLAQKVLDNVNTFSNEQTWDMIHLSYTAYVPNLTVKRIPTINPNLVLLNSGVGSALGTTAYLISSKGIDSVIAEHEKNGYYAPIPDVMAKLFPVTRYAAFPVPFLRAPKTKSLVNPQLDELRSLLFQPIIYTKVEKLLVFSGLSTNYLLPLTILVLTTLSGLSGKVTLDSLIEFWQTGSYQGNIVLPLLSSVFSFFSLLILGQGIALAPKPPSSPDDDK